MKDFFVGWFGGRSGRFISDKRIKFASIVAVSTSLLLPLIATAQIQQAAQSTAADYTAVYQDANSQVWQQTVPITTNQQGQITYRTNSYKELATGMNHLVNGQWVPSSDEITITATGGVVTNCAHSVGFATDINSSNAVEIITPDGQDLKTHIMGVSYFDSATGSNVLFAELQSSTGLLMKSNEVVYPNAFTGAKMDVKYHNKISSFEQDIVIQEQLPDPSAYGLTPATTWLQVWTEFLNPPAPVITPVTNDADIILNFGSMTMPSGRAFIMGDESNSVSVKKQWLTIQGRTFLVEAVPLNNIAASLQTLPVSGGSGTNTNQQSHLQNFPKMLPPRPTLAKRSGEGLKLATASAPEAKGLVMDYITVSTETNFTFCGDMTYYVSGAFNLNSNTTFEGGTIIKYADSGASLNVYGAVNCNTGPYRPAIFTSKDDNSVGLTISGSSGSPTTSASSDYLEIETTGVTNLSNLRMSYASVGIELGTTGSYVQISNLTIRDCQFVSNNISIAVAASPTNPPTLHLQNVLFAGGNYGLFYFESATTGLICENVTSTTATFWTVFGTQPTIALTNCIIFGTFTTPSTLSTNCTAIDPGGTVFQSLGAGNYYLATNSPYQNVGTTNIDPTLLADLQRKTTYPPLWLTNTITAATTLYPQAQRDTDTPDLGYHYDPIDYLSSCVVTNTTLTLTNGVVLGYYTDYGVWIENNSSLFSQGSPLQMNRFVYYTLVQEEATILPGSYGPGDAIPINPYHDNFSEDPSAYLRFTTINGPQGSEYALYTGGNWEMATLTLRDCEIYGAGSSWNEDQSGNATTFTFQNNLFFEASIFALYTSDTISLYNNLFYGTANESVWEGDLGTANVTNHDNAFEGLIGVTLDDTNGWNAFISMNTNNVSPLPMTNDVVLSSLAWQTGPLGSFYQPTNSPLIAMGSRSAPAAGLYHYTVLTNQTIEGNATNVTIGYHYVALGTNGLPLDSNGDGIPDYLEDANGNGIYDAGDLGNWAAGYTNADSTGAVGLQVFTPLH